MQQPTPRPRWVYPLEAALLTAQWMKRLEPSEVEMILQWAVKNDSQWTLFAAPEPIWNLLEKAFDNLLDLEVPILVETMH